MADVELNIAGRSYLVTCRDGEESHLLKLGDALNLKAQEAGGTSGGMNESRLLLFAGLLLADELHDLKQGKADQSQQVSRTDIAHQTSDLNDTEIEQFASALEKLADRIEQLSRRA